MFVLGNGIMQILEALIIFSQIIFTINIESFLSKHYQRY